MHVPQLIEHKRDGGTLSEAEIAALIAAYNRGEVPDYQMSAFAMAVYFQGMDTRETAALTASMRDSGRILKYPANSPPKVDKHSTGGVGDKVSLVLAPLLACDRVWVPMVSGRGLGITGGTLDKLESIPGFRTDLSEDASLAQLEQIGVFMAGQTNDFCPADKKLYALRDVTGTVPSIPLIIASIMSKKLAESLDRLVLDVKYGPGAFMKTRADAESLAAGLQAAGEANGVDTKFLLTPMAEPLGRTVGNALEVREAAETLQGRGPEDLIQLTLQLASQVSTASISQLQTWLQDGTAWRKWLELVAAQGGDITVFDNPSQFQRAPFEKPFPAPHAGQIIKMDAQKIGQASVQLGAGRQTKEDIIDFAAGFSEIRKTEETVGQGEPLFIVHCQTETLYRKCLPLLEEAVEIA